VKVERLERSDLGRRQSSGTMADAAGGGATAYLTTPEAAAYLRRSVSWLLRQPDIPHLRGNPNVYKRADLDAWFERARWTPRME